MTPQRWQEVKPILAAALELGPEARRDYVDRSCPELSLREEVLSLIAAHIELENAIETPPPKICQSIKNGTRLGSYTILARLGAGGMGEVYEAMDSKLDRKVAIKVLPQTAEYAPGQLSRFKREARILASLNHPGICTVFDVGEREGEQFIVMELLQGKTLKEHLKGRPLATREVLELGIQIADGLAFAHSHGIVHRDIKPANIFITNRGQAKILDFGLAKQAPHGTKLAHTGTTERLRDEITEATIPGIAMGTVAYTSPEQVLGEEVDARSDIFAFGAVIYEMATGRKAFEGKASISIMMKILETDPPPLSSIQPRAPLALDRVIATCLAKDPGDRWQSARDLKRELEWIVKGESAPELPTTAKKIYPFSKNVHPVWWAAVSLLFVALFAIAGFEYSKRASIESPSVRFSLFPPQGWNLTLQLPQTGRAPNALAVSPDGRSIAFLATNADGKTLIWIRSLDELDARPVEGTDGAASQFWSPSGRYLGFFADGKLKKIDVSGGAPITLCDAPSPRGGTWNQYGVILFAPTFPRSTIERVSENGGVPSSVTTLMLGDGSQFRPGFLPDGRHFLYRAGMTTVGGPIYIGSLDSTERKFVLNADSVNVAYSQGYLLFLRQTTLMAQAFDAARMVLSGDAFPVAEQIFVNATVPMLGVFSASENGVLAYQTGTGAEGARLEWFDRAGKQIGDPVDSAEYGLPFGDVSLSPDGRRLAVSVLTGDTRDNWLYDFASGVKTRFTFGPKSSHTPIWSPDGSHIIFSSNRNGHWDLYEKSSDGSDSEEAILQDDMTKLPSGWSPDGRFILYDSVASNGVSKIFVLPLLGDRKPFPFQNTSFSQDDGHFSPDGRWVAYVSLESGRQQVYVAPFPGPGGKWQVSSSGGGYVRWRSDGTEIFYLGPPDELMAVAVNGKGANFKVGPAKPLFLTRENAFNRSYDVSPDGRRFLISTSPLVTTPAPATVVVNWAADLKK